MSIRDAKLVLSDNQTVMSTDLATNCYSTNLIDLGAEDLEIGEGTPLYLNIRISEAYTYVVGATGWAEFSLQTATGSTFVDTDTFLVSKKMKMGHLAAANLTDRWVLKCSIPGMMDDSNRYLRLKYWKADGATGWTNAHFDAWISGATPDSHIGT